MQDRGGGFSPDDYTQQVWHRIAKGDKMMRTVVSAFSLESAKPKNPTSFRLSDECLRLIARLSENLGINQTAVIEQAMRKRARAELVAEDLALGELRGGPGTSATNQ